MRASTTSMGVSSVSLTEDADVGLEAQPPGVRSDALKIGEILDEAQSRPIGWVIDLEIVESEADSD